MTPVTIDDRRKELALLLGQIKAHPERNWSKQRQRVVILREMVMRSARS